MNATHYRIEWLKDRIVDIILGKNHLNHIITTIDLGALKFSSFLSYTFYENQSDDEYNSD